LEYTIRTFGNQTNSKQGIHNPIPVELFRFFRSETRSTAYTRV